jgi:hypothetical protein
VPGRPTYYEVWRGVGGLPHGTYPTTEEYVASGGERVFAATAQPRKAAGQSFRFAVAGDVGAGSPEQRAVAAALATLRPDFLVVPGDFMYSHGRVAEYWATEFFRIYGEDAADPARGGPLLRSTPVFGGLGQHDSEGTLGALGNVTAPLASWSPSRGVPGLALGPQAMVDKPHGGGLVAGASGGAARVPFHDGNAWYMYWDFPLNGPPGAKVWPMGAGRRRRSDAPHSTSIIMRGFYPHSTQIRRHTILSCEQNCWGSWLE